MRSKTKSSKFLLLFILLFTVHYSLVNAGIKDRVVAFVENHAITLSELEEQYAATLKVNPNITKEEVIATMVNRLLLIREANKIKLEALSEDELLKEYIDLKIRAFVRIKEQELTDFYEKHLSEFQGKEFDAVRDEIENYLTEEEVNQRLKSHINELREKTCVNIQLNQDRQ